MTDVTMIGLGAMGSALARAFLGAGHGVTVWNRTVSKMEPLSALGANAVSSISEAVEASPVIVICIDNYDLSRKLILENSAYRSERVRKFCTRIWMRVYRWCNHALPGRYW